MSTIPFITLASQNPVDHMVNQGFLSGRLFGIDNVWIWSAHVGNLVLAGILTVLVMAYAARKISTGPESEGVGRYLTKGSFASMVEVVLVYLRENTARPLLGARTDRFMPVLWTFFFYILFNNLLGLVPISDIVHLFSHDLHDAHQSPFGGTATQNIFVTAALALLAGAIINISGIFELGIGGYLKHLTAGTPKSLWLLMIPIEIMGTAIKPVALAIRLFANMTAGHILVATLFMFSIMGIDLLRTATVGGVVLGGGVTLISVVAAIAIYFLELFVAFLQAFVFMFLTAVFIAQLSPHHDHEHEEAHGHEHAHA